MSFNNKRRAVHESHSQIDLCLFDCHTLPMKPQVTGREKVRKNSLAIPFSPKMCFCCNVLSCIWYFSITGHFFRICTFLLEFRGEQSSLENPLLVYNLHSNCPVVEKAMESKRSVCLPGALPHLSLSQCNPCCSDFKETL